MDIKIYTISGCSWCSKTKELMKKANVEYKELLIGRDIIKDDFKKQYPEANSYPFVVIDDKVIGGLVPTVKYFVEKGLVSSKKNEQR